VLGLQCSWCPESAPMPNIPGRHALPPAATGVPSKRRSGYARRISIMLPAPDGSGGRVPTERSRSSSHRLR
jgi:hypothetical protein